MFCFEVHFYHLCCILGHLPLRIRALRNPVISHYFGIPLAQGDNLSGHISAINSIPLQHHIIRVHVIRYQHSTPAIRSNRLSISFCSYHIVTIILRIIISVSFGDWLCELINFLELVGGSFEDYAMKSIDNVK